MKAGSVICGVLVGILNSGCSVPECTNPDYGNPECRVVAENELARLQTPGLVEVRFQDPRARTPITWDARGLLRFEDGMVRARVAGPGLFAISLEAELEGPNLLTLELSNVDPQADIWVDRDGEETPVLAENGRSLRRRVELELEPGEPVFVRGRRGCPERYRVAFVGDIQTNPAQFERILEMLERERVDADSVGEPLVALVIPGDLTEDSRDDEFETVLELLGNAPVPVVVTPGNHDIFRPDRPHFNRRFGPGNHVVEVCDLRLVMLDTGSGTIARSVEARLPELLGPGEASDLILSLHHPPYAGLTGAGWSQENRAQRLLAEAAIAGVDLIVAGHAHTLRDFPRVEVGDTSIREIIVGTGGAFQGVGEPRFGFVRVTLGGETPRTCFVEVPPSGYDSPQGQGLSDRLDYCD